MLGRDVKSLFPIKSIEEVVMLFRTQLLEDEPDLSLLSIVLGFIENTLTSNRLSNESQIDMLKSFPVVDYSLVEELMKKFQTLLTARDVLHKSVKTTRQNLQSKEENDETTRDIIKKISDIIWYSLLRTSHKDRAHLQSLYSYLHDSKLDCFGVALTTVAACQLLGYTDVNLALSEDHVWLNFGKTGEETMEITWHGKGAEDKRGQSVVAGIETQSWIYVNGFSVVCNRFMEVAAMCASINPSLSATSVCTEVAELQQQLLWMLYDLDALKRYPMGLSCLAELEEMNPSENRPTSEQLYQEAVRAGRTFYKNHHVYPSVALAGFYYRKCNYKKAFSAWADAGDVIRLYNYSRDDEEIYKEFLDIANEIIPGLMKTESSGHSGKSILRDPHCFANLLRFYDGVCMWEEGSLTPILHIGWAKPMVHTISKFDFDIRSKVIIKSATDDDYNELHQTHVSEKKPDAIVAEGSKSPDSQNNNNNNNNNIVKSDEDKHPSKNLSRLEALTAACGEKILNPDFLLQGGDKPFTTTESLLTESNGISALGNDFKADLDEKVVPETNGSPIVATEVELIEEKVVESGDNKKEETAKLTVDEDLEPRRPEIKLFSHKMKALKELLLAEKLNTNAISLQITAQSQVQVGGKKSRFVHGGATAGCEDGGTRSSKRVRRE